MILKAAAKDVFLEHIAGVCTISEGNDIGRCRLWPASGCAGPVYHQRRQADQLHIPALPLAGGVALGSFTDAPSLRVLLCVMRIILDQPLGVLRIHEETKPNVPSAENSWEHVICIE